ncbi:MAG TPA: alpha/beta hydrolase [Steroidobacteraceae bacterium]|nr:alpha/beta hydrolase [Steroidobacteraceae bacterium]
MTAPFREQRWSSADGLELYCRVYETNAARALTVLCLPGLTRNSRDFEALAPHLAARYRVICPDLRGRGFSARDPQWQNYHPGTYLADLQRLMQTLDIARTAIIGTSLGGLLAMMIGATAPERVAGIVLNDVGPEIDPKGIDRIKSYTGMLPPVGTWEEALKQLRAVYGNAWPDLADEMWLRLVRRGYRADASGKPVLDCDPRVGDALRAAPPPAPEAFWPVFARLGAIPMLVIRGALSDILSVGTLERMQREKPDLERIVVGNRGHVPLLDEPEVLVAIDRFLGRLKPLN